MCWLSMISSASNFSSSNHTNCVRWTCHRTCWWSLASTREIIAMTLKRQNDRTNNRWIKSKCRKCARAWTLKRIRCMYRKWVKVLRSIRTRRIYRRWARVSIWTTRLISAGKWLNMAAVIQTVGKCKDSKDSMRIRKVMVTRSIFTSSGLTFHRISRRGQLRVRGRGTQKWVRLGWWFQTSTPPRLQTFTTRKRLVWIRLIRSSDRGSNRETWPELIGISALRDWRISGSFSRFRQMPVMDSTISTRCRSLRGRCRIGMLIKPSILSQIIPIRWTLRALGDLKRHVIHRSYFIFKDRCHFRHSRTLLITSFSLYRRPLKAAIHRRKSTCPRACDPGLARPISRSHLFLVPKNRRRPREATRHLSHRCSSWDQQPWPNRWNTKINPWP